MPRISRKTSADEIAEMASRGEDVSAYFTNKFTVVRPVRRVNVDLTQGMLRELDERAARLNISRQAVIKTLLGRPLSEDGENQPRNLRAAQRRFPDGRFWGVSGRRHFYDAPIRPYGIRTMVLDYGTN
jgi:hypothetical protein